jgi:hypothetical protein
VSEVFNTVLEPIDAQSRQDNRNNLRTILEWRTKKWPVVEEATNPPIGKMALEDSTQELFEVALLIFLERMSGGSPERSAKLRSTIDMGFALFSQLGTLVRQFPVLILGCEARTDKERMVVLNLISRTEEKYGVRSLQGMEGILQSLWAQDDLFDSELDYKDKLQAVLSSRRTLPSFV